MKSDSLLIMPGIDSSVRGWAAEICIALEMSPPGSVGGEAVFPPHPAVTTSLPPGAPADPPFLGAVGIFSCSSDKVTVLSALNHSRPLYTLGVHPLPSLGRSSEGR